MSRLFDALEKAAADRARLHNAPHDADHRAPAPSSGTPLWRKASLVGILVGFVVVVVTIPRLVERQQRAPLLTPAVDEGHTVSIDTPTSAGVAAAPLGPTTQPTVASETAIASATESRPASELPGVVGAASPEPEVSGPITARPDSIAPAARRSMFSVQVGAFKNRENAVRLQAQLVSGHHPATIHAARAATAAWAVQVGRYVDRAAAEAARIALAREGVVGFVVPSENEGTARSPSQPGGR